jgi:hypothetical protein
MLDFYKFVWRVIGVTTDLPDHFGGNGCRAGDGTARIALARCSTPGGWARLWCKFVA